MKILQSISGLLFLSFIFISCEDKIKTCINDVSGTYSSTNNCNQQITTIEIGQSPGDNEDITINLVGSFGLTSDVTYSNDICTITIPSQELSFVDQETNLVNDIRMSGNGTLTNNEGAITIIQEYLNTSLNIDTCIFILNK